MYITKKKRLRKNEKGKRRYDRTEIVISLECPRSCFFVFTTEEISDKREKKYTLGLA